MPAEIHLTARQQEIWQFLVTYVDDHGYPPTVREIGEEVGLASPSTVHAHLANLERVGLIRRDPTKPRAIELSGHRRVESQTVSDVPRLPLLGRVAAGGPLLAEENVEDVVAVPETIGRGADFLLTVHGDSMIEAGIHHGDFIFVKKQLTANRGDIVVAMINDEATVKYFHPEPDQNVFKPANHRLQPIVVKRRDFKSVNVIGLVVGVYRRL